MSIIVKKKVTKYIQGFGTVIGLVIIFTGLITTFKITTKF